MNKRNFDKLVASVQEAGKIRRGERRSQQSTSARCCIWTRSTVWGEGQGQHPIAHGMLKQRIESLKETQPKNADDLLELAERCLAG